MLQNLRKQEKGFTIIEVMIVLVIAAVIILIVFLAVPALQRNSRNTQYRNAAAAILATANEYVANNNGTMPTGCAIAADGTISITGTGTAATGKTQGGYSCANGGGNKNAGNPVGAYNMNFNNKCNGNVIAANQRSFAVTYTVETASSTAPQCSES